MYIDPRVAHGRAKFDLGRNPRIHPASFPDDVMRLMYEILGPILRKRPGQRDLLCMLERELSPKVRKLGVTPFVGHAKGGAGFFLNFLARDAQEGIVQHAVMYDIALARMFAGIASRIEPHAIARCLQRIGKERVDDIESEIAAVFATSPAFVVCARVERWAQIGVPTPHGLFVGEMPEEGPPVLKTFIRPGENGRHSRWEGYRALFEAIPVWDNQSAVPANPFDGWAVAALERATQSGPIVQQFPFLAKPYERRDDPLDEVWRESPRELATARAG
ncbi:hypothetical protein [Paraburkholderia youngii]|uniref:hypothetical protein n=1 Tax=Paraburkholderia youngii TaxID=2782701 RepID=UPI003D1E8B35